MCIPFPVQANIHHYPHCVDTSLNEDMRVRVNRIQVCVTRWLYDLSRRINEMENATLWRVMLDRSGRRQALVLLESLTRDRQATWRLVHMDLTCTTELQPMVHIVINSSVTLLHIVDPSRRKNEVVVRNELTLTNIDAIVHQVKRSFVTPNLFDELEIVQVLHLPVTKIVRCRRIITRMRRQLQMLTKTRRMAK